MKLSFGLSAAAIALSAPFAAAAEENETTYQEEDDVVVVSGSPLERSETEALVGLSVLSGEELARNLAGNIGETLRKEPGISSTFFGAGASRPIIRGQGGDRIRTLTNGIGSIDAASASPDHAAAVEPALAERIEIIRGTGLLRYGSSGSGGVVNVIDNRLPSEVPENGLEGALRYDYSSVDEGNAAAGAAIFSLGSIGGVDVVGNIGGTWKDADDYDIPGFAESALLRALEEEEHEEEHEEEDHEHEEEEEIRDTMENSFVENDSYTAGLSFIGDNHFLAVSAQQTNSTYGIPGGHEHAHEDEEEEHEGEEEHEEEHGEEEGVFIELEQTRYDLNGRFTLGTDLFEALAVYAGYADYAHTEFEAPGEPGTVFSNEGWEARAELIQTTRGSWRGANGLQYRHREFSAIGEEAFVPPTESEQWGLYTFQEWRDGQWLFEVAGRYEMTQHKDSVTQIDRDFDGISLSFGTNLQLNDVASIGGSIFRTQRAPTSEELFSNGPHLATNQFEQGNPDLDMEQATGVEGKVHLERGSAHLELTVFHTAYQDYIYETATGLEEDELPVFMFTAADAQFSGFEIDGDMQLAQLGNFDLTTDIVVDYVEATIDVEGNDALPRIPPLGVTYGIGADSPFLGLRAELEYAAEQDEVTDFELPTDSYTLVNTYLDWRPFAARKDLTLSVAVLNATDEDARIHSSFLKDEVPLPGRNVRLSLRYGF